MLSSFLITFRESLEAALIIGIILSYLFKTKETQYNKIVYIGIVAGIFSSILGAIGFQMLANGFEGHAEKIFEGITMLIGAALLTTMIFWMLQQREIAQRLQEKIALHLSKAQRFELFALAFVAIFREGIETVIFLEAARYATEELSFFGALLGVGTAIVLGFIIFVLSIHINLKRYFTGTSILLLLFAAGLVAHGVHELEEAELLPSLVEHVWDINPAITKEGVYPFLHEKGTLGSFAKGLFGYNGDPSLLEVLSWIAYIIGVSIYWRRLHKKEVAAKEIESI